MREPVPVSIEDILKTIELPATLRRIEDERPAFHLPVVDDRRFAYYLAEAGVDPVRLVEALDGCILRAGYVLEYCERMDFFYSGAAAGLRFSLDSSPEGSSAKFDSIGRPVEVTRTWHHIPAGRLVVTFAI